MDNALNSRYAVLIFANSSSEELRRKSITNDPLFYDRLNERSLQLCTKLNIPCFHFTENEQIGSDFGERFTNAIQQVFQKGYDGIITIGNDTPTLSIGHLKHALLNLKNDQNTLGPSKDGGFYLLGLQKSCFDPAQFQELPWQTSGLLSAIIKHLNNPGIPLKSLKQEVDLDDLQTIRQLLDIGIYIPFDIINIFLKLVQKQKSPPGKIIFSLREVFLINLFNKGSPFSASF